MKRKRRFILISWTDVTSTWFPFKSWLSNHYVEVTCLKYAMLGRFAAHCRLTSHVSLEKAPRKVTLVTWSEIDWNWKSEPSLKRNCQSVMIFMKQNFRSVRWLKLMRDIYINFISTWYYSLNCSSSYDNMNCQIFVIAFREVSLKSMTLND